MLNKQYFLIIPISIFIIICNIYISNVSFGLSSFIRQEIKDELNDVIDLRSCDDLSKYCYTAKNLSKDLPSILKSIDIQGASYVSNGKFLNATLWLSSSPIINFTTGYILFIDIDSNPATGAGDGAEYMIQLSLDEENKWTKKFFERSDFDLTEPKKNYRLIDKEILQNSSITNPLQFDIDLKDLNFPDSFNMIFYSTTGSRYEDDTSWIHIPPPEIDMSFSENPLNIRPGEVKTVYALINSSTGLEPIIELSSLNNSSNLILTLLKNQSNLPPYGITTIPIQIFAKNVTSGEQFFFPIDANSSFPFKGFRPETTDNELKPFFNTTHRFTLVLNIQSPLEFHEHIKNFVENWFNPLTGVYQTASTIIGGIVGYILAKIKNKPTDNNIVNGKKDSTTK